MPSGADGRTPTGGGGPAAEAARHLAALVPPLRFAVRDGFAALARLSSFEELLRGAVGRARAAGAPDSAALRGLAAAADGFDRLASPEKKRALARIAGNLSALIPVPEELRKLAARGRVEARAELGAPGPSPADEHPEPRDAAERKARRSRLRARLSELPRAHPAPRALLEERGYLTVEQALSFWPKSYQDRTLTRRIAQLRVGEEGIAVGQVRASRAARMRSGKPMLKIKIADASGRLDLVFFNPPP